MAITDQHSHVIAGMATAADEQAERETTRKVAERYRKEFIDLREQRIDPELFRAIPADLMFRYNFVPLEKTENRLAIAVADPSKLMVLDEIAHVDFAGSAWKRACASSKRSANSTLKSWS